MKLAQNHRIKFGDVRMGMVAHDRLFDCWTRNSYTMGEMVNTLEMQFAKLFGYKHTTAVSNGTTADLLACLAQYERKGKGAGYQKDSTIEFGRAREIIVPALSFIATTNAVALAGFRPRFVDIKRETLNIDETKIEAEIDEDTVAIMAVNTMGKPCRMDVLRDIANRHELTLIVDNCEAHACKYDGKMMAEWADISTYSAYAAHLIFAVEMGFVCCNDEKLDSVFRSLRSHGRAPDSLYFKHDRLGWNAKPSDLHAAIGLESVQNFKHTFESRVNNLRYLLRHTADLSDKFYFNLEESKDTISPHAFTMTLKEDNPEGFKRFYEGLEQAGIQCKLNFGCIPTQQPCYSTHYATTKLANFSPGDFPEAEHVGRNGLHMACHQFLDGYDLDFMVRTIHEKAALI